MKYGNGIMLNELSRTGMDESINENADQHRLPMINWSSPLICKICNLKNGELTFNKVGVAWMK